MRVHLWSLLQQGETVVFAQNKWVNSVFMRKSISNVFHEVHVQYFARIKIKFVTFMAWMSQMMWCSSAAFIFLSLQCEMHKERGSKSKGEKPPLFNRLFCASNCRKYHFQCDFMCFGDGFKRLAVFVVSNQITWSQCDNNIHYHHHHSHSQHHRSQRGKTSVFFTRRL